MLIQRVGAVNHLSLQTKDLPARIIRRLHIFVALDGEVLVQLARQEHCRRGGTLVFAA
jgi:hypothetical protein